MQKADTTLTEQEKDRLLLDALPGAVREKFADQDAIRFGDNLILRKQVTHLGKPWPGFKKRIQIPASWPAVDRQARAEGLTTRFVGIYHHDTVTIFTDFDPVTYVRRKTNNSAAHVSTNDLYQAQTLGIFSRTDRNGNRLTSVRADKFEEYLHGDLHEGHPRIDVFSRFNAVFLTHGRLEALDAIKEMYAAHWPDCFQGEWPGFYLEFRLDRFLRTQGLTSLVEFQRLKTKGQFDYDLVFKGNNQVDYYGDLKASDISKHESPGNDAENLKRCVSEFGRFWYIIYEHETWKSRNNADRSVIEWNEWRRSVGYHSKKPYNPLSYAGRFKEAVWFQRMSILEINEANIQAVLDEFHQGRQQSGAARALKVMIRKKNIDNFLVYSAASS